MNILLGFLIVVLVIISFLLILVILMQRPRQEGLGATFGGNITESVFGAQATNVLEKATVWLVALFFIFTVAIAMIYSHRGTTNRLQQQLRMEQPTAGLPSETAASAPISEEAKEGASEQSPPPSEVGSPVESTQ
jgi:preprotein translocase subunit SecG